jgi:phosphatidylethanolamine-binding protein (PEBP) family uncharacterized protein
MEGSIEMAGGRKGTRVVVPALSLLAVALLAGCGGGGSSTTTASVPVSPASAPLTGAADTSKVDAVAYVAGTPISKASYKHWLAVETALGASGSPSHQALGFLITSQWVLGEAAARHVNVSEAEVKQRYTQLVHQSFPKAGTLQKYLAKSQQTEADLLARIKVELLAARIAEKVTAGKSGSQRSALLTAFENNFHAHWKGYTSCDPGYVMEDCKQYKGKPEDLTASSSRASSSSSTGSSSSSASSSAAASGNGEVYTAPGAFSITSTAFERNGALPAQYTCTGAGISPPLSWTKVPAKAAELFLFAIAEGPGGSGGGGIRWVVGGIDPSSTGVAAGQTPPGGIVGTNTAGKAAYSPVCPPKGKSETVEFVMYALSKKLPLSTGFQPTKAESEYGSKKLTLGQAAVNYAIATGP